MLDQNADEQRMTSPRHVGLFGRMKRVARYRLHIPMIRNRQPVQIVARGVMVGMICAMTPFFGLHMALVLGIWIVARRFFKWDFSLVNGLAWTWITNVFTVLPAFYLFYVTGQVLMGQYSDPLGYDMFKSVFQMAEQKAASDPGTAGYHIGNLWQTFGLPLFLGSAVWATISGWLAYRLSTAFVLRYREHRARKMAKARKRPAHVN